MLVKEKFPYIHKTHRLQKQARTVVYSSVFDLAVNQTIS